VVVAVEPGRWRVSFDVEDGDCTVSIVRMGEVGEGRAIPGLRTGPMEIELEWSADRVRLRYVTSQSERRPTLRIEFSAEGRVLNVADTLPMWHRDGAWIYDLWLVGPRASTDAVRVVGEPVSLG
jgi:hypothetical protein